ncbi:MAG: lipoprotein [Pseudomonadales bacterium]|nr:lipoprotein [Pseudomonadales bacterium]
MRRAAAVFILVALLAGCGQKGPLYRPGEKAPEPVTTAGK